MNRMRQELIALATFMPEPALQTSYIVLRTVWEIYDASEGEQDQLAPEQQLSNVIDIRTARAVPCEPIAEPTPIRRLPEAAPPQPARLGDEARSRRITEGQERLARLGDQIDRAAAKGQPTEVAEELFSTFRQSLSLMERFDETLASEQARAHSR